MRKPDRAKLPAVAALLLIGLETARSPRLRWRRRPRGRDRRIVRSPQPPVADRRPPARGPLLPDEGSPGVRASSTMSGGLARTRRAGVLGLGVTRVQEQRSARAVRGTFSVGVISVVRGMVAGVGRGRSCAGAPEGGRARAPLSRSGGSFDRRDRRQARPCEVHGEGVPVRPVLR
jgi:hypothetical protein